MHRPLIVVQFCCVPNIRSAHFPEQLACFLQCGTKYTIQYVCIETTACILLDCVDNKINAINTLASYWRRLKNSPIALLDVP